MNKNIMLMRTFIFTITTLLLNASLFAQEGQLTLEKIITDQEYRTSYSRQKRWIDQGEGFTTLERTREGTAIVRHSTSSGDREVLLAAPALIPNGAESPLDIHNYEWSHDKTKLLIYTNSKRVWRVNSRGDYWIKDLKSGSLRQLGKSLPESSLMFAKFSPDDKKVAYVSQNNLYLESLETEQITQLTFDGTDKIINGTFDWAYEEEFLCRDGFRWSPDSKQIAFWQLDAHGIRDFLMINNTDSLYSFTIPVQYPKAGTTSSACKVGVIDLQAKKTKWMGVPGDSRDHYIPRMEWADNSREVIIQQLNRHQNTNKVMLCNAQSGEAITIYTDTDEAWLDVVNDLKFFRDGKAFTWVSEKNGWRNIYEISRDGQKERLLTPGHFDVIDVELIDTKNGWVYYLASPTNATQRYLYRNPIDKPEKARRLTPSDEPGTHSYDISPNGKWAFHTYAKAGTPPVTELISLPGHKVIKVLEDNQELKEKLNKLDVSPMEFFTVETEKDLSFDGFMIRPPNFDPQKRYPVLFYVYGEPWGQTVVDNWGGTRYLYHQMLAQNGYIVMSIDNRGTPAPKGRAWRKSIYTKLGVISSTDQAVVTEKIIERYPFVDSSRIGIWGWSGGGSMTLNALFRYPEIYKMGVSVAPVADIHLYDNIYQERYCGLPSEKEDEYYQSSPVNFAKNLEGELLLIHGTGDDNVHYQNSELLINELIRHNKIFSFMAYPNRSHGIYEGYNTSRHLYETMFDFIKRKL